MPQTPPLDLEHVFQAIIDYISGLSLATIAGWFGSLYDFLKIVGIILSLVFLTLIIYVEIRLSEMEVKSKEKQKKIQSQAKESGEYSNARWLKIVDHINSSNQSDWRLAILEADIILEEMLAKMGYHGETLSDKLKSVDKSEFNTIESAWEAHKIRNAIAHEGSDFLISEREAKRVIKLYEEVFKEFKFI